MRSFGFAEIGVEGFDWEVRLAALLFQHSPRVPEHVVGLTPEHPIEQGGEEPAADRGGVRNVDRCGAAKQMGVRMFEKIVDDWDQGIGTYALTARE